jgi:hypothetical protein
MKTADLYDTDFAEWAQQNAELLRSGRVSEADLENIAEEIEDLGRRERHALESRFMRLMEHLLKWQYQPERRGNSWRRSMLVQRQGIQDLLEESPSLRPTLTELIPKAYGRAASLAALATGHSRSEFPVECPFTLEQLLDDEYLP